MKTISGVVVALFAFWIASPPRTALAWGDDGHRIIALVADRFLEAAVRTKIAAILAADSDDLTAHDIASEATWADRYRDSDRNGARQRYEQTWRWHFVNVELGDPNLACFGHPALPAGTVASNGPSQACIWLGLPRPPLWLGLPPPLVDYQRESALACRGDD